MLDFTPWDQLLRRYVGDRGQINYQAWQQQDAQTLQAWLDDLSQIDLQQYPDTEQRLALWINLYNALTIAKVLERYPIDSIRPALLPKPFNVPNWIAFIWFFLARTYPLGGTHYSLNRIEHQVLRKQFNEPRIHFALVCASVGCPLLRNEAYFPERVRHQLEDDAVRFINNPDKVRFDHKQQTLYCSKIFKWYKADFQQASPSLQDYIRQYLHDDVPVTTEVPIVYLPYDLSLNNQRISS
ncbi:MAG: DUF547 domain-containing protein [Elainellaceae cyanobacterium]